MTTYWPTSCLGIIAFVAVVKLQTPCHIAILPDTCACPLLIAVCRCRYNHSFDTPEPYCCHPVLVEKVMHGVLGDRRALGYGFDFLSIALKGDLVQNLGTDLAVNPYQRPYHTRLICENQALDRQLYTVVSFLDERFPRSRLLV